MESHFEWKAIPSGWPITVWQARLKSTKSRSFKWPFDPSGGLFKDLGAPEIQNELAILGAILDPGGFGFKHNPTEAKSLYAILASNGPYEAKLIQKRGTGEDTGTTPR